MNEKRLLCANNDCWLKNNCNRIDCNKFCMRYFKLNYLYDSANISINQRRHINLRPDDNNSDISAFKKLKNIELNIEQFVKQGTNLYLHSNNTGNGKTSWALRLVQAYFNKIWFKCNLSCRYCIEHDVVNHAMAKEIDPMIIDWLLDIANNIHPINILFWGGEPLVYFDTMQKVVDMVKSKEGNKNITFSMVTNGKLLNDKTIPWIKENLKGFGLSWDGRNSKITRGYDVIAQNKENLFKLDKEGLWGFDGVFSSYCYPKDYLDDCYEVQKEFGHEISVHIENLMQYDTELPNPQLKKFDENKFYQQMEEICEEYLY